MTDEEILKEFEQFELELDGCKCYHESVKSFIVEALDKQRKEMEEKSKCKCCNKYIATICPDCSDHWGEQEQCPNN